MANNAPHEDVLDWVPDWISGNPRPSPRVVETQDPIVLQSLPPAEPESRAKSQQTPPDRTDAEDNDDGNDGNRHLRRVVDMAPDPKRTVNRKLRGIQLLMITLNATLGTGLYWRGGQMLWVSGPLAMFLSFLLVGALAWAVMQCIAEMLCIWPVPGALSSYVASFIDPELGIAVGVAYWFTYAVSFSALMSIAASELAFWGGDDTAIKGGIVYLLIPLCLVLLNAFEVEIYGWFEVITGSLKAIFLLIITICLLVIKGTKYSNDKKSWEEPTGWDKEAAGGNWGSAFLVSISIATFAYIGVEIVAASALEARWSNSKQNTRANAGPDLVRQTVKFTAVYFPFLTTAAYTLSSLFASFDIDREDEGIARFSWVKHNSTDVTSSFVAVARNAKIPGLADAFNVFLVFTALTCANTNLFVASRSLFGLTARLKGGNRQPRYIRILAFFGQTNRHRVPIRAVLASAVSFCWVPFVELSGSDKFIEVLTQMGSVSVIIVWACNCWAFMRYYECIKQHRVALETHRVPQVRRWDTKDDDYPYRSHWQPYLSWVALGGCLFILVVADGSPLWHRFKPVPFLSGYLFVIVFVLLWAVLKYSRGARWALVDLSNSTEVIRIIRGLHEKRFEATFDPAATGSEGGSRS
ncbi:putative proline-specific permease [Thelonectria olida]|uniref:Proline-specific permease n=1 Tax=Thelonectria olida TaxID=1576542 RepID=A0A9P8VZF3_9HYPO|nr:putative proline-specific permease [Thelonectria olida]